MSKGHLAVVPVMVTLEVNPPPGKQRKETVPKGTTRRTVTKALAIKLKMPTAAAVTITVSVRIRTGALSLIGLVQGTDRITVVF